MGNNMAPIKNMFTLRCVFLAFILLLFFIVCKNYFFYTVVSRLHKLKKAIALQKNKQKLKKQIYVKGSIMLPIVLPSALTLIRFH